MEMILLSRFLNRILVLPNFYFTPRNNELINKTNSLIIDRVEFIDISNVLDLDKLKEICNFITVTDYFKLISEKELDTILICKPCEDVPINKNKYYTIYGNIKISSHLEIDYDSLSILNYFEKYNHCENIIIHNYNRMYNPLWYKNNNEEYYKIRNCMKFNKFLNTCANQYENIDFNNTLLVHLRRGDFNLTDILFEGETNEYYKEYNNINNMNNIIKGILLICTEHRIKNIFLLTNETNKEELNILNNELIKHDINMIIHYSINDNNYMKYIINDINGIIIGSKCKYQLYTGKYDRMSQYGRWLLEEYYDERDVFFMKLFD